MHTPVLLEQVLSHVHIPPDKKYIDCTLGEGGHTLALARRGLAVLAVDADQTQIDAFVESHSSEIAKYDIRLAQGNYANIAAIARKNQYLQSDGILFDFGLSMAQLTHGEGFSYKHLHQPLDMIIDTVAKQRGATRAADVVGLYTEDELTQIFERYGERTRAGKIAHAIVEKRRVSKIETVGDLVRVIERASSHVDVPAIFQAIRIEVNNERENIIRGLQGALEIVKSGGTIQIITFHSNEDRIVKLWARRNELKKIAKYVGRELSRESYEQSAVLRVYENTL